MSKTEYKWQSGTPPMPDVYTTRRNKSRYTTMRYWDGERWFEIALSGSRGGVPFQWPKNSRTKLPNWADKYRQSLRLRNIGVGQDTIEWGEPFKVYDEREVLAFLVKVGHLRADWRTAYQQDMRLAARGTA